MKKKSEIHDKKDNMIDLEEEKIIYRFVQEIYKKEKVLGNGEIEVKENVLIMIEQAKGKSVRRKVHPVTEFLLQPMKKGGLPKVSSLKTKASYIIKFLNYVLIQKGNVFKVNDLYDLRFEHGVEFLGEYGTTGVKKNTVISCENVLKSFYYFLCRKGVLKNIKMDDFEIKEKKYESMYYPDTYINSPFYGVSYPSDKTTDILHYIPQELIIIFIDTAITYTQQIALGVYFQFFGGLRLGEVVNISKSAIRLKGPYGRYGMILSLTDRKFRKDLKHASSGGAVKKVRKQAVFPYKGDILGKLYKSHINKYISTDGSNALFVNNDGKAMTDFTYRYYFNKLKEKFLDRLKKSNSEELRNYSIDLRAKKWSTHIGRGVFSNMIAEVATNIAQIRQARGDNSYDASFAYLSDSAKMAQELYNNQIDMWRMLMEELENGADI